jgi:hypothetical protein
MNAYALALFFHLLFLLVAAAAASLSTFASLRLRAARDVEDVRRWQRLIDKVVPAFPTATLGLFATGAYMTERLHDWSMPWVWASVAGLAAIVVLGSGIEARRGRALARSIERTGMSHESRRLLCDPVAWTAKLMTLTLALAVMFIMTAKPPAADAAAALVIASLAGALCAVPIWRPGAAVSA